MLAYTPPDVDGRARLTLARVRDYPGDDELFIVRRDLEVALKASGRHWEGLLVEPWLRRRGSKWWYHAIEWRELQQRPLLE